MIKQTLLALALTSVTAVLSSRAENIVALTSGNRLLSFDSATPGVVTKTVTVTGLTAGESLIAIDFRPATGGLFALGSSSRLYAVNVSTGVASPVGSAGTFSLNGTKFDLDFNPTVDRARIVSDTDQNIRVNPNDGSLTASDTNLAYSATDVNAGKNPNVVGSAYTNSFSTATQTILYDIDSAQDVLAIQNPPNSGTLNTVGALGVDTTDTVGFDISGQTGQAFAALTVGGTTNLFTINLITGAATAVSATPVIGASALGTETVVDIAAGVKPGSRLLNMATRAQVGTGENILIGGFIAREGVSERLVIRAIGPSLAAAGVTKALQDPTLLLFDKNGAQIGMNDDFGSSADQAAELAALGLAPTDPRESALVVTLTPDRYTAQVVGKNNTTGVALIEVYELQ